MNVIGAALAELYRCFEILNYDKFDGELPEPVITIQKGKGNSLGYFTLNKVWVNKTNAESNLVAEETDETAFYEINIDPRYFYERNATEIVETLLHEMVHYFNKLNGIKDCNGNIHNKKFKQAAEEVGLIVEKDKSTGYGITSLSDELREYIEEMINPDGSMFEYFRACQKEKDKDKKKGKKTLLQFTCPQCGQIAKAKNGTVLKCGVCEVNMDMESVESDDESDEGDNDKEDSEDNDF